MHLPTVDPNFLYLSARDENELMEKANSAAGTFVSNRAEALNRYIAEAEQQMKLKNGNFNGHDHAQDGTNGNAPSSLEARTVQFLKEKKEANDVLHAIYARQAGKEREQGFFEASQKAWAHSLPEVINGLEQAIIGPYALGDQIVCVRFVHVRLQLIVPFASLSPISTSSRGSRDWSRYRKATFPPMPSSRWTT